MQISPDVLGRLGISDQRIINAFIISNTFVIGRITAQIFQRYTDHCFQSRNTTVPVQLRPDEPPCPDWHETALHTDS